jgi:maltose O-acetyltransferase
MGEKAKMLAGALYVADDPELAADAERAAEWMDRYNARQAMPASERQAMLRERFAFVGDGAFIRPPFHCDYGANIRLGAGAFLNFGCVVLDVVEVSIGELTQIGPGVQILTADHPRDPALRRQRLEFGRPVRIGCNVWIGGGALLMPGVVIGDDAVIGGGAVVTRDVRPGATVAGNPARPLPRAG